MPSSPLFFNPIELPPWKLENYADRDFFFLFVVVCLYLKQIRGGFFPSKTHIQYLKNEGGYPPLRTRLPQDIPMAN